LSLIAGATNGVSAGGGSDANSAPGAEQLYELTMEEARERAAAIYHKVSSLLYPGFVLLCAVTSFALTFVSRLFVVVSFDTVFCEKCSV
jgi:hypothetical protein